MKRLAPALLTFLLLSCRGETADDRPAFDNAPVIVISIDTLRSDRLPAYGYDGVATPAIDALRRDSILFEHAYAHVPLTLPSHATLLTGQLPTATGVRNNVGATLPPGVPTMASAFKAAGYATGAALSAWVLRGETGLGSGFDAWDDRLPLGDPSAAGSVQRPGGETVTAALSWIEANREQPFFYLLHLFEPHTPWAPPEPFASRYAGRPYDGEVATADQLVGTFLDRLRALGLYESAIIVLLSDHGEGLGDHGEEEHGIFLYREAIQVPLLIKLPGNARAGTSVDAAVGLIDLFPTLARLAAVETPDGLPGTDILTSPLPARTIVGETIYPRVHLGWSELHSAVSLPHHFIDAPSPELYDLERDPAERTNLIADQRRVAAALRTELAPFKSAAPAATAISDEERAKLEALGYLGSTAAAATGPLPDPKERIEELGRIREAVGLAAAGQTAEAATILDAIVAQNPRSTDAVLQRARLAEQAGDSERAIAAYRRAIELNPENAGGAALSLGELYLRQKKTDEAERHARLALDDYPALAKLLLGAIALERRDHAAASTFARELLGDGTYRPRALVLLAQAQVAARQLPEALATLETARNELVAAGRPFPLHLEFTRGDVLMRMNRLEEGEQAFLAEIRLHPRDPRAYQNLAAVYLLLGKAQLADQLMESMVRAHPIPGSYEAAAATFERLGERERAERWRERARRN